MSRDDCSDKEQPTPRTDALVKRLIEGSVPVPSALASHAEQLERELADANDIILKHHELLGPLIPETIPSSIAPSVECPECNILFDPRWRELMGKRTVSASASKPDDLGARAVSFHEWWDAQSDELFIVPSHAIKGWAWKAWNAALSREHTDIEQSRG